MSHELFEVPLYIWKIGLSLTGLERLVEKRVASLIKRAGPISYSVGEKKLHTYITTKKGTK